MSSRPANDRNSRSSHNRISLRLLAALLAIAPAGITTGCNSPPAAVDMWIVAGSPSFLGAAPDPYEPLGSNASPRRVELAGAISETLSFRFAVRTGDTPIERPVLHVTAFDAVESQIDPSVVQLFRIHRVSIEDFPGWHIRSIPPTRRDTAPLDVLVPIRAPRGGLPATMPPGTTYRFWADVAIPKGTPAGTYTASIELTSGNAIPGVIDVQLVVWPFILPDEGDVAVIAELDHRKLFRHHLYGRGHRWEFAADDWRDSSLRGDLDMLLRSTVRLLQTHRLTPVLHRLAPLVKIDARGGVAIDWGQYDAVATPYLNGQAFYNRVPLKLWPMPVHAAFSSIRSGPVTSSPGYQALLRRYLAQCTRHFDANGWLDRSYAMPPSLPFYGMSLEQGGQRPGGVNRRTVSTESVRVMCDFATAVRSADERIRIVSRLWPQDMAPYGWPNYLLDNLPASPLYKGGAGGSVSEVVDIWLPPAQYYDVQAMADQRAAGRRTWVAVDRPPFSGSTSVFAPSAHVRVLTWQAKQLGAEAIYLGCINRWPDAGDRPTPEDCVRVDPDVLLYPGGPFGLDEPVASVRLKHLRQSLQDAAYRQLLSDRGLEHIAATLGRSLAPYAGSDAYRTHFADGRPIGWPDDPAVFDLARKIMGEAMINSPNATRSKRRAGTAHQTGWQKEFARSAHWRRFMLATRMLRIFVDGTRVRLTGSRTAWEAEVECTLTIVNHRRVPVAGTVGFSDLSEGWTVADGGRTVPSIAPNGSRRVMLTARATMMPTGPDGVLMLPIEFTTDEGVIHRSEARVCFVTAVPFAARRDRGAPPIRVDGDLSEWPPGATNVASDFRLITGGGSGRFDDAEAHPHRRTVGFILRDGDYLYVAISAEAAAQDLRQGSRRNSVNYEDMIPVGEELIELLIDPRNTGTRSPADLYHIVVKPSGTYMTEKGIRFDPPCGEREPWPADIDVATGVSGDRWTVELRIPLDSFDRGATAHAVWGFNITRYDASRREFSTWSGASGNAYDPLSLGNLYLP